jgi:hypothetical protein
MTSGSHVTPVVQLHSTRNYGGGMEVGTRTLSILTISFATTTAIYACKSQPTPLIGHRAVWLRFQSQLPHFDRTIEELMDMSSSTEPYVDGVCSVSIESMVSECGTAAKALENAIHTDISQVATLALKSLNAAFDAIDHACTLLRDVKMDTREAMKVQAHQLNSHFATAKQDWVEIEEITARASQNTKNFQHTTLDQTIKSIGSVEMELSGQMNKTRLAKMQIERRLASLRQQLNAYRERATHAKSQSQDAHNRTIIFSIVSNVKWDTAVTENRN